MIFKKQQIKKEFKLPSGYSYSPTARKTGFNEAAWDPSPPPRVQYSLLGRE